MSTGWCREGLNHYVVYLNLILYYVLDALVFVPH